MKNADRIPDATLVQRRTLTLHSRAYNLPIVSAASTQTETDLTDEYSTQITIDVTVLLSQVSVVSGAGLSVPSSGVGVEDSAGGVDVLITEDVEFVRSVDPPLIDDFVQSYMQALGASTVAAALPTREALETLLRGAYRDALRQYRSEHCPECLLLVFAAPMSMLESNPTVVIGNLEQSTQIFQSQLHLSERSTARLALILVETPVGSGMRLPITLIAAEISFGTSETASFGMPRLEAAWLHTSQVSQLALSLPDRQRELSTSVQSTIVFAVSGASSLLRTEYGVNEPIRELQMAIIPKRIGLTRPDLQTLQTYNLCGPTFLYSEGGSADAGGGAGQAPSSPGGDTVADPQTQPGEAGGTPPGREQLPSRQDVTLIACTIQPRIYDEMFLMLLVPDSDHRRVAPCFTSDGCQSQGDAAAKAIEDFNFPYGQHIRITSSDMHGPRQHVALHFTDPNILPPREGVTELAVVALTEDGADGDDHHHGEPNEPEQRVLTIPVANLPLPAAANEVETQLFLGTMEDLRKAATANFESNTGGDSSRSSFPEDSERLRQLSVMDRAAAALRALRALQQSSTTTAIAQTTATATTTIITATVSTDESTTTTAAADTAPATPPADDPPEAFRLCTSVRLVNAAVECERVEHLRLDLIKTSRPVAVLRIGGLVSEPVELFTIPLPRIWLISPRVAYDVTNENFEESLALEQSAEESDDAGEIPVPSSNRVIPSALQSENAQSQHDIDPRSNDSPLSATRGYFQGRSFTAFSIYGENFGTPPNGKLKVQIGKAVCEVIERRDDFVRCRVFEDIWHFGPSSMGKRGNGGRERDTVA